MRNSAVATSVRLPKGANAVLDRVVKKLNVSKTDFIRRAIIERIEDELDISEIEKILKMNNKTLSLSEVKNALEMAD
jgi:predicted DNA-binding protein